MASEKDTNLFYTSLPFLNTIKVSLYLPLVVIWNETHWEYFLKMPNHSKVKKILDTVSNYELSLILTITVLSVPKTLLHKLL